MDLNGPIAQRFPLIYRFRPACLPLPRRVHGLAELADAAAAKADQGLASAVYNQAALIASDLGLPDLARKMCHQHAAAYLHATPLPGMTAIRALEPVVNLARLQIRAGAADDGRHRLLHLFDAVTKGTSAQFEGVHVPADLTLTDSDRHEVRTWLWKVVLADGTRTLTTAGRWAEALAHIEEHRGIGQRMLDGRQVAVLAALSHTPTDAAALITMTTPGERWENAVTGCLDVMCRKALRGPAVPLLDTLVEDYVEHQPDQGMTVFDTRLGLTILGLLEPHQEDAAHRMVAELHRRAAAATDGYAACECLADHRFTSLAEPHQIEAARQLVRACALGSGSLPEPWLARMTEALRGSDEVIRASVGHSCPQQEGLVHRAEA
ncbi:MULTISPECIES: hypothetical protein [unclassified Streptomyces]|uniref:hypothetical protein n=1 Tax=unclassified Streptomyces TaxID=2593676 RepID=UPI002275A29C|nr:MULTISPECIES: hypothetical protein [unclassified Streptomyces]MCY1654307.1 hypothetical protein [Streptomyces sp. SL203]MCY1678410.1 hypothetical protein [Streptomyces sp. SL294]